MSFIAHVEKHGGITRQFLNTGLAIQLSIQSGLDESERDGGVLHHLLSPLHVFILQLLQGNHFVHQPHFECFLRIVFAAEKPAGDVHKENNETVETVKKDTASAEEMWSEINKTNLVIAKSTGYAPDYVRFPGGSVGKSSLEIPLINVNWNMDSIDYKYKNQENGAEVIFNRLIKSMGKADGGIVLLHSIYQNSYDGVTMFLEHLSKEGYELVTLSELFYYKGVTPEHGVVYVDGNGTISKKVK